MHKSKERLEAEKLVTESWDIIDQLPDGELKTQLLTVRKGLSGVNLQTTPEARLPEVIQSLQKLVQDAREAVQQALVEATNQKWG